MNTVYHAICFSDVESKPVSKDTAVKADAAAEPTENGKEDLRGKNRGHGDRRHGAPKHGDKEKAPQVGPDGEPKYPRKREFDRRSSTGRYVCVLFVTHNNIYL